MATTTPTPSPTSTIYGDANSPIATCTAESCRSPDFLSPAWMASFANRCGMLPSQQTKLDSRQPTRSVAPPRLLSAGAAGSACATAPPSFPRRGHISRKRRADILATHEGLGETSHGHPRLDALARAMRVKLVVHGNLHHDIDYQREGLLGEESPFLAYGLDQDSHLSWVPGSALLAPALMRDRL